MPCRDPYRADESSSYCKDMSFVQPGNRPWARHLQSLLSSISQCCSPCCQLQLPLRSLHYPVPTLQVCSRLCALFRLQCQDCKSVHIDQCCSSCTFLTVQFRLVNSPSLKSPVRMILSVVPIAASDQSAVLEDSNGTESVPLTDHQFLAHSQGFKGLNSSQARTFVLLDFSTQ